VGWLSPGGVLVDAAGWRSIFLINIPIGIAALVLTRRHVAESRVEQGSRTDLVGTALLTLALIDLVLPLVEGRQHGWPAWTWLCLGAAPVTLALFAVQQRRLRVRGGSPLVDPALFRDRAFTAGLATQLAFASGLASFFLVFALYLQQGRGLTALEAGLVFTILAAAYLATSMRTPQVGRRAPALGAITIGAGQALLALTVSAGGSIAELAPALLLMGAGMGLVMAPLTATVLAGVSAAHAGAASGVLATMQQIGNALGVAVTGVIFFGAADQGLAHAFELSLIQLAVLSAAVAALTRLLPRPS
jgi:MFS family permease